MSSEPVEHPGYPDPPRTQRYTTLRLGVLTGAFLIILVNPFINYFLHNNFLQGWYQSIGVGALWFVSPLEGLESLLITKAIYMPSLIGMIIPLTLAFLLGRVFCSWICPVTFILELVDRLRKVISKKKYLHNKLVVAKRVLWFTLIAELVLSMVIGAPLFVFSVPSRSGWPGNYDARLFSNIGAGRGASAADNRAGAGNPQIFLPQLLPSRCSACLRRPEAEIEGSGHS